MAYLWIFTENSLTEDPLCLDNANMKRISETAMNPRIVLKDFKFEFQTKTKMANILGRKTTKAASTFKH